MDDSTGITFTVASPLQHLSTSIPLPGALLDVCNLSRRAHSVTSPTVLSWLLEKIKENYAVGIPKPIIMSYMIIAD
jgi:hypothetical protein